MKTKLAKLSRRYQDVLRKYVKEVPGASLRAGREIGGQALAAGLHALDLAKIHDEALDALDLAGSKNGMLRRSRDFFAEAIMPMESTHRGAVESKAQFDKLNQLLGLRTKELFSTNRQLKKEIVQRRKIERSLGKSKRHYGLLLEEAVDLQEELRRLSRQILSAQEEERKKISRELHDVIAQTLTGINIQLAKLKSQMAVKTHSASKIIFNTQLLVEKSVNIVHRFARELRPTVLDDLGLIPALHTFMKSYREQTGIFVSLTAPAEVEHLSGEKRTVLYRVAQEGLTNVARHSRASRVDVKIQKLKELVRLKIKDNGQGFAIERALRVKKNRRLGLLGMRERVEMVHGRLTVKSTLGKGTTIMAQIPFNNQNSNGSARARSPRPVA